MNEVLKHKRIINFIKKEKFIGEKRYIFKLQYSFTSFSRLRCFQFKVWNMSILLEIRVRSQSVRVKIKMKNL